MAINLKSTGSLSANGVKLLVYGQAGAGKTTLVKTLPNVIVLSAEDGRAAYGEMNTTMQELIRAFRDLPGKHVYMSAKLEKSTDEMGKMLYNPGMPGKSLTQGLPYFFDEVLALRVERDSEGVTQRALMCDSDGLWLAKDRSGKLESWEAPDLGAIITKIGVRA